MASATSLTPNERTAFQRYFEAADTSDLGVLTGELAVAFFAKSQLPPVVLGEIWGIADEVRWRCLCFVRSLSLSPSRRSTRRSEPAAHVANDAQENDGFLSKARFDVAARLIGHAQRGEAVIPALASRRAFRRLQPD